MSLMFYIDVTLPLSILNQTVRPSKCSIKILGIQNLSLSIVPFLVNTYSVPTS